MPQKPAHPDALRVSGGIAAAFDRWFSLFYNWITGRIDEIDSLFATAEFITASPVDGLGAERVTTTSSSITVNTGTTGQIQWDVNDEYVQDLVGALVIDSSELDVTYDDSVPSISAALKTTGVVAASYGSATQVATFTVDSKGRLTAAGNTAISITSGSISDFTEAAQDVIGGLLADSTTINYTYDDATNTLTTGVITQMSITSDASGLKLSGDEASPGPDQVYGTDGAGVKGWKDDPAGTGGGGSTKDINQTGHGFSVGHVVYLNGSTYTLADADAAATAEVVGIVSDVADADNFTLHAGGWLDGLSGLTAGTVYFLSATPGALTATEPSTVGQISKPLLVADTTTSGYFFNFRGMAVGNASSSFAISRASGDGSTTAFALPAAPVSENNVIVTITGVVQHHDTYSVSGSTLTFTTAPPTGTDNIEFCVVSAMSIGTPSDGTVNNAKLAAGALFTQATEQATTSGTSITFTGIPSDTQIIIVRGVGVSQNGTAAGIIRIGPSGGVETTNYSNVSGSGTNAGSWVVGSNAAGVAFTAYQLGNADNLVNFTVVLTLEDAVNNTWVTMGTHGNTGTTPTAGQVGGSKSIAGAINQLQVLASTTNSFDAGAISIMYR